VVRSQHLQRESNASLRDVIRQPRSPFGARTGCHRGVPCMFHE
jgi:hypothetical protein